MKMNIPKYQLNMHDKNTIETTISKMAGVTLRRIYSNNPLMLVDPRFIASRTSPVFRPRCHRNERLCKWENIFTLNRSVVYCCIGVHKNPSDMSRHSLTTSKNACNKIKSQQNTLCSKLSTVNLHF